MPLLVKIAPDLADDDVAAVADLALRAALDGIIATNTTISRDGLRTPAAAGRADRRRRALRARRWRPRSLEVLQLAARRPSATRLTLDLGRRHQQPPSDARDRLDAGATLVQAYTGFVYGGPLWPRRILERGSPRR